MTKIEWDPMPGFLVWNRLRELRRRLDRTQMQVAAGAGISIATVWYIEHGYDASVAMKTRKKIARYFGCSVSDIFPAEMIGNLPAAEYLQQKIADDKAEAEERPK